MKRLLYFMSLVLVALFSACTEGTDFDIEYTPIAPIGGQYKITLVKGYDPNKTDAEYWASNPSTEEVDTIAKTDGSVNKTVLYAFLSNTTDYDKDKAWIRVGTYAMKSAHALNAKVSINMSDYTFGGDQVDDFIGNSATSTDNATVSGQCGHNTYTTVSGTVTDEISFTYSRSDQPGWHYKAHGFKYTGWAEDTH